MYWILKCEHDKRARFSTATCHTLRASVTGKYNYNVQEGNPAFTSTNQGRKAWQRQEVVSLKRGSRVTELAVCGSSPHNHKKKKNPMYWSGETTKTDTDGSWQQLVLCSERERKRGEQRSQCYCWGGFRLSRWDARNNEALKFRLGNKAGFDYLRVFCFFYGQYFNGICCPAKFWSLHAELCKTIAILHTAKCLGRLQEVNST